MFSGIKLEGKIIFNFCTRSSCECLDENICVEEKKKKNCHLFFPFSFSSFFFAISFTHLKEIFTNISRGRIVKNRREEFKEFEKDAFLKKKKNCRILLHP